MSAEPQFQWVAGAPVAVVALDMYELVNLREVLLAIMAPTESARSPLDALNSGDWVGQILFKLPQPDSLAAHDRRQFPHLPNATAERYRERAREIGRPQ